MITFEKDNYLPVPSDKLIAETEDYLSVKFPKDFISFLKKHNGAVPNEKEFDFRGHGYCVETFLNILEDYKSTPYGWYDMTVVATQLEDRLVTEFSDDLYGVEIVPFAALFAGDFVCFDYRDGQDNENPPVCIFYHEESYDMNPYVLRLADNFSEFLEMLY